MGPKSLSVGFRFPYKPLTTNQGAIVIPSLLLGLDEPPYFFLSRKRDPEAFFPPSTLNPGPNPKT